MPTLHFPALKQPYSRGIIDCGPDGARHPHNCNTDRTPDERASRRTWRPHDAAHKNPEETKSTYMLLYRSRSTCCACPPAPGGPFRLLEMSSCASESLGETSDSLTRTEKPRRDRHRHRMVESTTSALSSAIESRAQGEERRVPYPRAQRAPARTDDGVASPQSTCRFADPRLSAGGSEHGHADPRFVCPEAPNCNAKDHSPSTLRRTTPASPLPPTRRCFRRSR